MKSHRFAPDKGKILPILSRHWRIGGRIPAGLPTCALPMARLAGFPPFALQVWWHGPVAQGVEQQPSKLKVAGSNPAGVANYPQVGLDLLDGRPPFPGRHPL